MSTSPSSIHTTPAHSPQAKTATWAADLSAMRGVRDEALSTLHQGREAWYNARVASIPADELSRSVAQYAGQTEGLVRNSLERASSQGESSVTISLLQHHATQGWRFADYVSPDEVHHRVWDLSMNVAEHQTRLRTADVIRDLIQGAGGTCEVVRYPAEGPDCFVETLQLKISL
jgi:hypothetical protein